MNREPDRACSLLFTLGPIHEPRLSLAMLVFTPISLRVRRDTLEEVNEPSIATESISSASVQRSELARHLSTRVSRYFH